jgi:hypothetical protein
MRRVIFLHIPTVFWLGGGNIFFNYSVYMGLVTLDRQKYVHTAEPIVPEPRPFEVVLAIERLKRHKSPGIDQIPAELIKIGGTTIRSEIHKPINSVWNREELPG